MNCPFLTRIDPHQLNPCCLQSDDTFDLQDDGVTDVITLPKMSSMRTVLNSTAMDIMYYQSPLYRKEVSNYFRSLAVVRIFGLREFEQCPLFLSTINESSLGVCKRRTANHMSQFIGACIWLAPFLRHQGEFPVNCDFLDYDFRCDEFSSIHIPSMVCVYVTTTATV